MSMKTSLEMIVALLKGIAYGIIFYLFFLVGILIGVELSQAEAAIKPKLQAYLGATQDKPRLEPREEMQTRAIRIAYINKETKAVHYGGNGVLIDNNKVLTNNHICEDFGKEDVLAANDPRLIDREGIQHKIIKYAMADDKDVCLVITENLVVKELEKLTVRADDPVMSEVLTQAAYSYANLMLSQQIFMYQEREAKVLKRSTLNPKSKNIIPAENYKKQFRGPMYKLSAIIYYGDSGSGVYAKMADGSLQLSGLIFAKEGPSRGPSHGFMIPASTLNEFLASDKVKAALK